MRLTLTRFLPVAAGFTGAFGLYYLYVATLALRRGNAPFAVFYGLFGLGGLVLAASLWRARQQLRRGFQPQPGPGPGRDQ